MQKIDPICGMEGHILQYDHYFCSQKCIEEYEEQHNIERKGITKKPWFKTVLFIVAVAFAIALVVFLQITGFMILFMGGFFVVVSILKFVDWKGFAQQFALYDVVAKRSKLYAFTYPVIEFGLGIAFLLSFQLIITATITFLIMSVGSIGVAQNLLSKNPINCACLGTKVKLPLTTFTLFEDVLMAIMALMILFA